MLLISEFRDDFKIMTHEILQFLPQLKKFILPVDFSGKTKQSKILNIQTAKLAKKTFRKSRCGYHFSFRRGINCKNLKSQAMMMNGNCFRKTYTSN